MKMKIYKKVAVTSVALIPIVVSGEQKLSKTQTEDEITTKPNILMICVDDLNDWIGCMDGHPNAITPNIDKLAERGTIFFNAFSQAPVCGPSRASIMSGLRPSTTGIYGQIHDKNIRKNNKITEKCTFLPEYFAKYGYKTMGIGKIFHQHAPKEVFEVDGGRKGGFGPKPKKRLNWPTKEIENNVFKKLGFRTLTDWGAFPDSDDKMPDTNSAKWAVSRLKEKHNRPFFLAVGFVRPHVPWHVPQKWFDMHPLSEIKTPPYKTGDQKDAPEISRIIHAMPQMPTTEWAKKAKKWKEIVQAYLACCTFVDSCIGQVLNGLKNSPYADNTIIVLWSDHGYHLGEKNRVAKHSLWERANKVPLIIVPLNGKRQHCNKPVELIDLYPTLVELAGLPANKTNEGDSLVPLLNNAEANWDSPAITTFGLNNHAIQDGRYRYIIYEDGSEELYDHKTDPNEWNNIADKPEVAYIKGKFKKYIPKINAPWTKNSWFNFNPYFKNQIKELGK